MRKNISSLLQRGNLKSKERVLLLVANQVSKEKDGKSILTEADEYALSEGWTSANNDEVREYNRYNEGWRLTGFAELDAQTTFLTAEISFLRAGKLVDYALWHALEIEKIKTAKDYKSLNLNIFDFFKKVFGEVKDIINISEDEALQLIIKNSGLELDKVIYTYAFESLSEDLKKDILALDPEAKTESQYLDQEEIIANLFNGKDKLTKEAKEKLADLILNFLYLDIERLEESKRLVFSSYFAELPALDILKKWADYNEDYTEKEVKELEKKEDEAIEKELTQKLKDYAEKNKKDIRDLLKETILKWLDEGLFIKEYAPIFNSDEKKTYEGKTKLPHKEVFREWLKAKKKAKETIQGLINKSELRVEERNWEIKGIKGIDTKRTLKIITGESLYNFKGDYIFAKDFRKQADAFKGLGALILFLRECRFLKDYAILLAFKELFNKLSKIYEVDLTYKIDKWINSFRGEVELLNQQLTLIADRLDMAVFYKHNITFLQKTFISDMLIDLEKIEPSRDDRKHFNDGEVRPRGIKLEKIGIAVAGLERYYQEFKKLFDEEF